MSQSVSVTNSFLHDLRWLLTSSNFCLYWVPSDVINTGYGKVNPPNGVCLAMGIIVYPRLEMDFSGINGSYVTKSYLDLYSAREPIEKLRCSKQHKKKARLIIKTLRTLANVFGPTYKSAYRAQHTCLDKTTAFRFLKMLQIPEKHIPRSVGIGDWRGYKQVHLGHELYHIAKSISPICNHHNVNYTMCRQPLPEIKYEH